MREPQLIVRGVGTDVPIVANEHGGLQSATPARMDLADPLALLNLGEVLQHGIATYPEDNWRKIEVRSHLNKCIIHILAFMAGDTQDDHLGHAQCRLHMALAKHLRPEYLGAAAK